MFRLCENGIEKSFPDVRTKSLALPFVMCELSAMAKRDELIAWRADRGKTLEDAAADFGIKSKGYLSEIENGGRCSVSVALEIERVTEGAILAASLNPDVALVDKARAA